MLMNAGLLILVWETLTVSVAATVKAFFPTFALYEMLVQAVLLLPLALLLTVWIDQRFLSAPPRLLQPEDHPEDALAPVAVSLAE